MAVSLVRPDVSDLVLRAYGRTLHPELFEKHCALSLVNPHMKLDIQLNASGHVLSLRMGSDSLTEVVADRHDSLPEHLRIVNYRLRGCRTESAELAAGLRYDMSCEVEKLDYEIFFRLNDELELDCRQADIYARFPAMNRIMPGALSLIRTDIGRDSMLVYTFHTFPEHLAIVRTQSLFELSDSSTTN